MTRAQGASALRPPYFAFTSSPVSGQPITINHVASGDVPINRQPLTINHVKRARDAFTLIELVTVILIISTLAALVMVAAGRTFDRARGVQAKNDLTQLVTAINAFYTEYGQYPVASQNGADSADYAATTDANAAAVMDVLRVPAAAPNQPLNPRSIVFLNVPVAKSATKPLAGIGINTRAWYDPWGKAYQFRIDNNYNNTLVNPYSANGGPSSLNFGCIAWSLGKNTVGGSGDKNGTNAVDDVLSWQ